MWYTERGQQTCSLLPGLASPTPYEVLAVQERAVGQDGTREEHNGRSDGNFGGIQVLPAMRW